LATQYNASTMLSKKLNLSASK